MPQRPRILVIEDDAAIRRGVVDALALGGYATLDAADGPRGLALALQQPWDLLLLDVMLPGMDGLTLLQRLRSERRCGPVIMLTARGEEQDRVRGLRGGADDYVVKPFGVRELLARVEAVLRRVPQRPADVAALPVPGGVADLSRREVRFDDGRRCELTDGEAALLSHLALNAGRVVSREELLSHVWRSDARGVESRTVDMHVARLREKLGDDPAQPRVILTVRGKGYMLASAERTS
jgi:DNA-binding response OmpR family regulator